MSQPSHETLSPFRQRAPFAGMFIAGCLGILASDGHPEWWPYWIAGFLLTTLAVFKVHSTWPALILAFTLFGFWHGNQVAIDQGYQRSHQQPFDGDEHDVTLVVLSEPKIDQIQSFQRFVAHVRSIDNHPANFQVSAECSGEPLSYGDGIEAQGKFQVPSKPLNPGQFDFGAYLRRESIYLNFRAQSREPVTVTAHNQGNQLNAFALAARHGILDSLEKDLQEDIEVAQTIQCMFLGARGEPSDDLKRLFRDTGTIHLFAASGLQLGFFVGLAWSLLRRVRLPRQTLNLAVIPVAIAYCALTEFHPATVRAVVMAIFLAAGATLERPVATINSLCGSGVLILIHDTQQLYQIGFQLSFVAVFTIFTTASPLAGLLYRPFQVDAFMPKRLLSPWQRAWHSAMFRICELFSLSAVCWLSTAPLLILEDHRISLVSVVANLLVVPLAMTVMLLGVASLAAGCVSSWIAACFNNTAWLITKGILAILHTLALIPGHSVNVSPATLIASDQVTALAAGYDDIVHIHACRRDWLMNTGRLTAWRNITAPYLQSQGVNRLDRLIVTDPPSHERKLLEEVQEAFPVRDNALSLADQFQTTSESLDTSDLPHASDCNFIEVSATSQRGQLEPGARWSPITSILVHLGPFRVLILPTVTEDILAALKKDHVDVVYCGRLRDRSFPRDLVIRQLSPSVLVMNGTKPELVANPQGNGAPPDCFFLKQGGSVTTALFYGELRIRNFVGSELRLPSRSR